MLWSRNIFPPSPGPPQHQLHAFSSDFQFSLPFWPAGITCSFSLLSYVFKCYSSVQYFNVFVAGRILCNSVTHVPRTFYGRLNNTPLPTMLHIPILGTYEFVTYHSKRDFADVIKLHILSESDYSGLSGGDLCNHKGLYKGDAGGFVQRKMCLEKQVVV